jgi:hypothetical protein
MWTNVNVMFTRLPVHMIGTRKTNKCQSNENDILVDGKKFINMAVKACLKSSTGFISLGADLM